MTMKSLTLIALIAAAPLAVAPLAAGAQTAIVDQPVTTTASVVVSDAYARSTNPRSGAAFMTIANNGPADCKLVGVKTSLTDKAELHTHVEENGVMKMAAMDEIVIPAKSTHALTRGGDHVMLMGLTKPLANGENVTLELDLGDCGSVPVTAVVDNDRAAPEATGGQAGQMGDMDHSGHADHSGHTAPPAN